VVVQMLRDTKAHKDKRTQLFVDFFVKNARRWGACPELGD
jgi:hypothetical protein